MATLSGADKRNLALTLLAAAVLGPVALLVALFPHHAGSGHLRLPTCLWIAAIVLAALLGLVFVVCSWLLVAADGDWEITAGAGAVLLTGCSAAGFVATFVHRNPVDHGAWVFVGLVALALVTLVLVAHQWRRRLLVITAGLLTVGLALFIVRAGVQDARVPAQWERAHIADQAVQEERSLGVQFDRGFAERHAAADAARAELAKLLGQTDPVLDVPAGVRDSAAAVSDDLAAGRAPASDVDAFDRHVANLHGGQSPPVTQLAGAVHDAVDAYQAANRRVDYAPVDSAVCVVRGTTPCAGLSPVTSHGTWLVAQHNLEVALAQLRVTVQPSDETKAALKELVAAAPADSESISLLSAVSNGPEALWRSAFHNTDLPLVPGPLGWVIIGSALLGLLIWLLKVNARQLAGPVEIVTDDKADENLVKLLRVAVLQNLDDPGAAPGAASANPVTTLLDIAGGQLAAVSKLVSSITTILGRRYGYRLTVDIATMAATGTAAPAAAPADTAAVKTRTTVLVRISSISDGISLASRVVSEDSAEAAVRAAGLWAAGFILDRSTRVPTWAAWEPDTAEALATSLDESSITLKALEQAVQRAPRSGLLLVRLGHQYELSGRRIEAITCYARAVANHPRYLIARYRLAVGLGMMRHDRTWSERPQPQRADDMRFVRSAFRAIGLVTSDGELVGDVSTALANLAPDAPGAAPDAAGTAAAFRELATLLLATFDDDASWLHRLAMALRRSERDALWQGLWPTSTTVTARFAPLARSARLSLDADKLAKLEKESRDRRTWWQISYNAACGYASQIDRVNSEAAQKNANQALDLLDRTLLRPGVQQLDAAWVATDPDLANLHNTDRFKNFVKQLRPGA